MNPTTEQPFHDHERKDVDVISTFTIVLTLGLVLVVVFFATAGLMHYFKVREPAKTAGQASIPATLTPEFPPPRLEVKPGASLAELRAAEDADLNSYGWIDKKAGTIRIPIDRAMELILERGLPDVGAGKTPLSLMKARPNETASPPRLMQKK